MIDREHNPTFKMTVTKLISLYFNRLLEMEGMASVEVTAIFNAMICALHSTVYASSTPVKY